MPKPGATVFVVDDDASVREALGGLVRSAGLGVATYATAQDFLAGGGPRADGPSCLVLDVRLPGLSGLDLQTRMAEVNLEIPIIFITGHGDVPTSVRAMTANPASGARARWQWCSAFSNHVRCASWVRWICIVTCDRQACASENSGCGFTALDRWAGGVTCVLIT